MNLRSLALAAALTTAIASPSLAMGPHARSDAAQQRLQESRMYHHHYYYRQGFWPGDVAAGTAGAIASASFGYYDDNYDEGPYPYAW
jgi:hypothetical protein